MGINGEKQGVRQEMEEGDSKTGVVEWWWRGNKVDDEEGNRDGEHSKRSNAIDEVEELCKWGYSKAAAVGG